MPIQKGIILKSYTQHFIKTVTYDELTHWQDNEKKYIELFENLCIRFWIS